MSRREHDAIAGIRGACASLAQLASQITEAVAEADATDKLTAGLVHVNTQRAALACLSLAAHAGRLEGLASAHADALAPEREALTEEAEHDARLYREDKATSGEHCPSPEEWAEDAFGETWAHATAPHALDRDAAWTVYLSAFLAAVARE
jgi:hypothetical protein